MAPMMGVVFPLLADEYVPPAIPSPITDHLALTAGYYWGQVRTSGQFNSSSGIAGSTLSAESTLGLTDQVYQPRFELMFRLRPRSKLRVNFFDVRRSGERVLDSVIRFGNLVFLPGQQVQSNVNWRQMDVTYTYSLLRFERFELGAGLGVHLVEGQASAQFPGTAQHEKYSQAEPFATVAVDGTYLIDRHWSVNARAQYLRIDTAKFSGLLDDFHGDVQYRWRRNLAFGASYDHARAQITSITGNPSGYINLLFTGPEVFVRVSY
jgi:hypothetical protein